MESHFWTNPGYPDQRPLVEDQSTVCCCPVWQQQQHARLVAKRPIRILCRLLRRHRMDIQLRPISVHILNKETRLSAGRNWNIECEATGSNPPAIISWWKSGKELIGEQNEYDTLGILHFVPTMEDDGKYLTCRANNPAVPDSTLEDKWLLNVLIKKLGFYITLDAPVVTLKILGAPISGEYAEGQEAVLQCGVKANPSVWKITWLHNSKEIQSNDKSIVMEGNDLILSNISSASSGQYRCTAHNSEGQTQSKSVAIIVRYSPICKSTSVHKIAAPENIPVSLKCSVEAHPKSNITFRWTFADMGEVPGRFINSSGSTSILTYKPVADLGYGQFACKAHNEAGETKRPCVYQVIPPGPPGPPLNCTLEADGEVVQCKAGFDGGLEQRFLAQVVLALDSFTTLVNSSANLEPVFRIPGLMTNSFAADNEAMEVQVIVLAENDLGRSSPVTLKNLIYSEKPIRKGGFASFTSIPIDPLLFALLITGSVVIILCCGICYLLRRRCCRVSPDKPTANGKRQKSRIQDNSDSSVYDEGIDDPDPDLIPNKEG
ncbi:nephrin-like [Ctenocephalides felis]|uniref:nephrin-like n=1 Tax=Ctenocephalides felis TaxID=7515 RepID=UPI000E6E463E|nr:nephrin-like [Ctenocephalides felis]